METKHTPIRLIKCPCGDSSCDYHGFSDGNFPQGSGWDQETAEKHLRACNAHAELVDVLYDIIEEVHPPARNCSCHISPPCSDCMDHAHLREMLKHAVTVLEKAEGK